MGIPNRWRRATLPLRNAHARDPELFRVRVGLGFVLLWLVLRLAFGDDPWTGGLAERAAEGHPPRPIDYVETWGWWTAAAIAPIVLLLLATAERWLMPGRAAGDPAWDPRRAPRAFLLGTAAALLVGGVLAAPRLDQSLFEDERQAVRDIIDGAYYQDGAGNLRFIEKRWRDTLWWYVKPSNHIVQSMLSRASLSVYRTFASPESRLVNETALRLPCLLAGLGSIGAAAFLLLRLGHPAAGVIAAWILALHPWHLRYATEARGYSVMLFLGTLSILALVAVLNRGTWKRWIAYGAIQFLLVLNYPLIGVGVAALNGVAVALLWRSHGGGPDFRTQLIRWFIVCLGSALLWIQLMTGNMIQLSAYLARQHNEVMDALWFRDLGAYFLSGTAWGHARPNLGSWELSDFAGRAPAVFGLVTAAMLALFAAGSVRLCRRGGSHALIAALLILPPILALALSLASGAFLFPHYLIFGLPGAAILVALGVEWTGVRFGPRGPAIAGIVFLVAFAIFTGSPRNELRTRAIQPFRDSVELTRKNPNPEMPSNQRILTVSFNWPAWYYDPNVKRVGDLKGLERWMERADEGGRPLYVNVGRPKIGLKRHPDIAAIIGDERLFEEVAYFPGLLSRGSRQVWRYRTPAERRR